MTGCIAWFTGLPGAGKSTLAAHVRSRLARLGHGSVILDSDAVRDLLGGHAYDPNDRDAFYRVLADLAAMLANQGAIVLVAATAPRHEHRDRARAVVPVFIEVYVRTPLEECEARDPKGLYARARGEEHIWLPGVNATYEPPLDPDVTATGGTDDAAAERVLRQVLGRGLTPAPRIHA